MSHIQNAFVWYELMSNDVAGAKAFYEKVVGWNAQPSPDIDYTILSVGHMPVGGIWPIPAGDAGAGMRPSWLGYIGVADVDAATAKVQSLGGQVHRTPTNILGVGRFSVVSDPQGAVFYLFRPLQAGKPNPSIRPGQVGWRELHATDWPKVFDFYSMMFGWTKGDSIDMGPLGSYQLFRIDGADVGGLWNSPAAKEARFWLFYFIVDDIDAAIARVRNHDGVIVHGPVQVPGAKWVIRATDPYGAMFALVGDRK